MNHFKCLWNVKKNKCFSFSVLRNSHNSRVCVHQFFILECWSSWRPQMNILYTFFIIVIMLQKHFDTFLLTCLKSCQLLWSTLYHLPPHSVLLSFTQQETLAWKNEVDIHLNAFVRASKPIKQMPNCTTSVFLFAQLKENK